MLTLFVPAERLPEGVTVDTMVWAFHRQAWVYTIPCPGEKRVRIDVFDDLSNYGIFEVEKHEDGTFSFDSTRHHELKDWRIDLS